MCLVVLLALLPLACASGGGGRTITALAKPPANATARPPAVGQEWVYSVRDLYTGKIVDEVTETVVSITPDVHIRRISRNRGVLQDEVQSPWGMLRQDSHWSTAIVFDTPLPAWPTTLAPASATRYPDRYQMVGDTNASVRWSLTMTPRRWDAITVAAGTFSALAFDNFIAFNNGDLSAVSSERQESVWFSPDVGRWVLRRSRGTVYFPGRGGDWPEDYFEWELVSWR